MKPIGNKLIVKLIKDHITKTGIILPNSAVNEVNGNAWAEITELPEVSENLWIKTMKVGGKVLVKKFQADLFKDKEGNEYSVVDVEPNDGNRPGQVLAYED
jgi:co-chaperonin GroES (HSP10)